MEARKPDNPPGQIVYVMELPLQEDIGAELDDFLTLGLLGIDDEARDLLKTVLWRRLRYFPVFAEVADYIIDKNDELLRGHLLATIRGQAIQFSPPDEQSFLDTVTEILVNPLSYAWPDTKYHLSAFSQWRSAISCQRLEITSTFVVQRVGVLNDFELGYILGIIREFIDRSIMNSAARFFAILAATARKFIESISIKFISGKIKGVFSKLTDRLVAAEKDDAVEVEQTQGNMLIANISYLRLLASRKNGQSLYKAADFGIEKILENTLQLLTLTFETLPETEPRGQHLEFCKSMAIELEESKAAPTQNAHGEKVGPSAASRPGATSFVSPPKPDSRSLRGRLFEKEPDSVVTSQQIRSRSPVRRSRTPLEDRSTRSYQARGTSNFESSTVVIPASTPERIRRPQLVVDMRRRDLLSRPYDHTPSSDLHEIHEGDRQSRYRDLRISRDEDDDGVYEDELGPISDRTILNQQNFDRRRASPPRPTETTFKATQLGVRGDPGVDSTLESEAYLDDLLSGFSILAKILLDKNVVTESFLENSAEYLKRNPRLTREEDVSHWRHRARSALSVGEAELARKLIQQAYLIELSQRYKTDGIDRFLRQENYFKVFTKGSYTTFLLYLNEAEDSGLLRGKRREMLTPWAKFMYWTYKERILDTLSLPPDSISADWVAEASVESKALQPSSTLARPQQTHSASTVPPPSGHRKADTAGSTANISWPSTDRTGDRRYSSSRAYVEEDRGSAFGVLDRYDKPSSATSPRSRSPSLRQRPRQISYRTNNTKDGHHEPREPAAVTSRLRGHTREEEQRNQRRERQVAGRMTTERSRWRSYDSDEDDDNDDDDDDDVFDDARDFARKGPYYEHSADRSSQSRPATQRQSLGAPSTTSTMQHSLRQVEARDTTDFVSGPRQAPPARRAESELLRSSNPRSQTIVKPQSSPGSQAVPLGTSNPIFRLSKPLIGFIGQKTYRDCLDYYKDNPTLTGEDLTPFRSVSIDLLRQGRQEAAKQVIERWVMLREANASSLGPLEWMKRLPAVPARQDALRKQRDAFLGILQKRADETPATSDAPTVIGGSSRSEFEMTKLGTQRPPTLTTRDRPTRPSLERRQLYISDRRDSDRDMSRGNMTMRDSGRNDRAGGGLFSTRALRREPSIDEF